jgi:hypothetical protein
MYISNGRCYNIGGRADLMLMIKRKAILDLKEVGKIVELFIKEKTGEDVKVNTPTNLASGPHYYEVIFPTEDIPI